MFKQILKQCKQNPISCIAIVLGIYIIYRKQQENFKLFRKMREKRQARKSRGRGEKCNPPKEKCKFPLKCREGICGGKKKGDSCKSKKECAAGTVCYKGTCGQPGGIFGGIFRGLFGWLKWILIGGAVIFAIIIFMKFL